MTHLPRLDVKIAANCCSSCVRTDRPDLRAVRLQILCIWLFTRLREAWNVNIKIQFSNTKTNEENKFCSHGNVT